MVYMLEYMSKAEPDRVFRHERLNVTELQLSQLTPATDYIVQIVAVDGSGQAATSGLSTRHFRTLANDLDAPQRVQVSRVEADKIRIKWEAANSVGVRVYRIYFRELGGDVDEDEDEDDATASNYDFEGSDEWKVIEHPADRPLETILEGLCPHFNMTIFPSNFNDKEMQITLLLK